jgi:hypothetical protein
MSALWLAVAASMIAVSAVSFARREDVRGLIRLSVSLAAIQLLAPLSGLIVAAFLPRLLGLGRKGIAQSAGLYALILFMPAITALVLLYLADVRHFDIPYLLTGSPRSLFRRLAACAIPLAMIAIWRHGPARRFL